jgi:hypothetical protein
MLHTYVQRFDVIVTIQKFLALFGTKHGRRPQLQFALRPDQTLGQRRLLPSCVVLPATATLSANCHPHPVPAAVGRGPVVPRSLPTRLLLASIAQQPLGPCCWLPLCCLLLFLLCSRSHSTGARRGSSRQERRQARTPSPWQSAAAPAHRRRRRSPPIRTLPRWGSV